MGSKHSLPDDEYLELQSAFDTFILAHCNKSPQVACPTRTLSLAFILFIFQFNKNQIRRKIAYKLDEPICADDNDKKFCILFNIQAWQRFLNVWIKTLILPHNIFCVDNTCVGVEVTSWPDTVGRSWETFVQVKEPYYRYVVDDCIYKPLPWWVIGKTKK